MFTGLIQDLGEVEQLTHGPMVDLWVRTSLGAEAFSLGESIAVDGTCLTVVERRAQSFKVQASPETLRRTTLSELKPGSRVNLERAMTLADRLGGHLVQGHVDGAARILAKRPDGGSLVIAISLPTELAPWFIEKGSVAVDGISLTVNTLGTDQFSVALIPETVSRTGLGRKGVGERVNLEGDLIGKYVARLHALRGQGGEAMSETTLLAAGFSGRGTSK